MKSPYLLLILFSFASLQFVSCSDSSPDGVLGERKMEDVLYDYHLAHALAQSPADSADYKNHLYAEAVFRKHHITRQEFESSMLYYSRHADRLAHIYEQIKQRYGDTPAGIAIGSAASRGDSLNLWNGAPAYLLSSHGNNRLMLSVPVDTAVQSGDRLIWSFHTQWLYHDGVKNAYAILTLTYANDSVVTLTRNIYNTGLQEIGLSAGDVPLSSISMLLYQPAQWTARPRLLAITSPMLIRLRHEKKPSMETPDNDETDDDSYNSPLSPAPMRHQREHAIQDSLRAADSARHPHFREQGAPLRLHPARH